MSASTKKIPTSILIFGAAGRIGRPLAEFLAREAPETELVLVSRNPDKQQVLRQAFPKAHVIAADYEDVLSLQAAVKGIEAVFVISSTGMQEQTAMTNLVSVLKNESSIIHVVRLLGIFPEFAKSRIPPTIGSGALPVEHPIAKRIFDESGLPVTYVNCGASFMDNLWLQILPVRSQGTFIWPEHRVPFIDNRDVSEVVGRLLLTDNAKHIGAFHTVNNGQDWLTFAEVAAVLSEVLDMPIIYDGSYEAFIQFYGERMGPRAERLWNFFKFEEAQEENWFLTNCAERLLGRKPITLREWIVEHRSQLLDKK